MKLFTKISIIILATLTVYAHADDTPGALVKTCATTLTSLDGDNIKYDYVFEIFKKADAFHATTAITSAGQTNTADDPVTVFEGPVRAGLTPASSPEGLSQVEDLVLHAMMVTNDPELATQFSVGFDLTQVRSATAYQVGNATNMGSTAIVVARDQNGKVLGSYLGGFMVNACK